MKLNNVAFLAGSKWAEGRFATDKEVDSCIELLKKRPVNKEFTDEECILIESSLNTLALSILRFSKSEWGNDYYDNVHAFRLIADYIDRHSKKWKYGQYFSLS